MAGIILQTLHLTPPPTKILSFSRRLSPSPPSFRFETRSFVRACHQIDGNGNKADKPSDSLEGLNWAKPLSNFAANNFLPIALVGGVALGFANPTLGCLADSYSLSKFSTFGIFIISGLTLHTGEIIAAADAWPVGFFGLV
ncbi:hypothetical protein ACLB2K_068634 [Fragaria x ananassa]